MKRILFSVGMFFCFSITMFASELDSTDYVYIVINGDTIAKTNTIDNLDQILSIGLDLDEIKSSGTKVINSIKEENPKGVRGWIVLILNLLLAGTLTTFITRIVNTVKVIRGFFKDIDVRDAVLIVALVVSGVIEFVQSGWDFSFYQWTAYAFISIPIAKVIYEKFIKRYFGKTPKPEVAA